MLFVFSLEYFFKHIFISVVTSDAYRFTQNTLQISLKPLNDTFTHRDTHFKYRYQLVEVYWLVSTKKTYIEQQVLRTYVKFSLLESIFYLKINMWV